MNYKYCAAIIIQAHKIFLLKRSNKDDDDIGKWSPVNGTIERDESEEKAVIREVKEEIGMTFSIIKRLPDHNDGQTAVFLGSIKGKMKPDPKEIADYGWFSYQDTKTLDFAFDYEKVIEDLFRLKLIKQTINDKRKIRKHFSATARKCLHFLIE